MAALIVTAAGCRPRPVVPRGKVSLCGLLADLTNVTSFAQTPLGRAGMISTYDTTGGNRDWAEWQSLGPDGLIELADLKGPGCVTRIWMTHVNAEKWHFYFDGEKTPRISVTTGELFGGGMPFIPPLCDHVSGGYYCFTPIPYRNSLRIAISVAELKPGNRAYYHVNYTTYPKGVPVDSFPEALSTRQRQAVEAAAAAWRANGDQLRAAADGCEKSFRVSLAPGQTAEWLREERDAGLVDCFWLRLSLPAGASSLAHSKALREVVLRLRWDGADAPSVEVPLGDFFCNAFHRRRFSSMALGFVDGRYVCRFPMPFAKSARGELVNQGSVALTVEGGCRVVDRRTGAPNSRFHATWNASMSTGVPFRMLQAKGKGHFVGCYLNAIGMDGRWTILEGDESFRVDGETVPSIHGTGLEDYFNGAWYYTGLFDLPLHGLTEKAPIRTDQYRFHLTDRIAFESGLAMNMEFGDGNRARGYMSSVAYWYQDAPQPAGSRVASGGKRLPPADPLEPTAIMAHLFELERAGLHAETVDRCREYVEKFPRSGFNPLLNLRALAYREVTEGYDAIAAELEKLAQGPKDDQVAHQARLLRWFHADRTHALLGIHIGKDYTLHLDGREVAKGGHPAAMQVVPVKLPPGEHSLTMHVKPQQRGTYASVFLRTHTTNVTSAMEWEVCERQPEGWPAHDSRGDPGWEPYKYSRTMYPTMSVWQFVPNGFVAMQSARQLLPLWPDYMQTPLNAEAYLRARFTVPEEGKADPVVPVGHAPEDGPDELQDRRDQSRAIN